MDSNLEEIRHRRASGEHRAVIRLAQRILENPEGLSDPEAFEVARTGASSAMAIQSLHVAVRFAEQEEFWAESSGDAYRKGIAAFHRGTALLYLGDTPHSSDHLEAFVALATGHPTLSRLTAGARFNLGLARAHQHRYAEAVNHFMVSRDACHEQGDHPGEIRALLEAAWVELLDGRPEPAGYRLEQARELLTEHPDDHLQVVRCVHQGFYHFRVGELLEALRFCEEIMLAPQRPGVKAHQLSEAAWIAGECALIQGNQPSALYMAAFALDEAVKANWPYLMNRAGDLRRRANQTGEAAVQ